MSTKNYDVQYLNESKGRRIKEKKMKDSEGANKRPFIFDTHYS